MSTTKNKTTGDYLDVEGKPFVIKKILTGHRILIKEMPHWPADELDWRKEDDLNRKGRARLAKEMREALVDQLEEDGSLKVSKELVETVFIPLLEGRALEISEASNHD